MEKSVVRWQIGGFVFTSVIGTLLHFIYNWSHQNVFFAPFSAVNESIWEHMKLLFVPMFVFALFENKFLRNSLEHFWCIKLSGILIGLLLIPVFYYTYTGIFGVQKDWINISLFFLAAGSTFLFETKHLKQTKKSCPLSLLCLFLLCIIALLFVVFTFAPPKIPLFVPPT